MASIGTLNGITSDDLKALNDEDFEALRFKVIVDKERREALTNLPQVIAQNAAQFRAIGGDEAALTAAIAVPVDPSPEDTEA